MLEIKNLTVSFRTGSQDFKAVDGISLDLKTSSFTSIVGESGSGKSVTALSICRLKKGAVTQGSIFYRRKPGEAKDLLALNERGLADIRGKEIAYVFQDPASSLNPVMKVGPQVAEAHLAHFEANGAEAKAKALDLFEAVRLKDPERVYGSFPHELSGGMRQRAMIAMALIMEPQILVADEPTTALDAVTEREIMELLKGLKGARAILFITHDLALAARYSDRIHVMKGGRIVETMAGGAEPREDYTRKLFGANLLGVKPKSFIGA